MKQCSNPTMQDLALFFDTHDTKTESIFDFGRQS